MNIPTADQFYWLADAIDRLEDGLPLRAEHVTAIRWARELLFTHPQVQRKDYR